MKGKWVILISAVALCSSCNYFTRQEQEKQAMRDSITMLEGDKEVLMLHYNATINEIAESLNRVAEEEGFITMPIMSESEEDSLALITRQIANLQGVIHRNNARIDSLRNELKQNHLLNRAMERQLEEMSTKLAEQEQFIVNMTDEMAKRDELIRKQEITINGLEMNMEHLMDSAELLNEAIDTQDKNLHTAWYAFGTYKELKAQNILIRKGLTTKVLQGDYNKDYFVKLDTRKLKEIPLYTKKAKVHTSHPKSSYTLELRDGTYVLTIIDSEKFWSVSNYLVIEVD